MFSATAVLPVVVGTMRVFLTIIANIGNLFAPWSALALLRVRVVAGVVDRQCRDHFLCRSCRLRRAGHLGSSTEL